MILEELGKNPEAPSVLGPGGAMAHQELDQASAAVAHALANAGIGRGQLVGLSCDRNPDLIVGLLQVKQAAAEANARTGMLDERIARAIIRSAQSLIDAERRYRALFDQSNDAIFIFDSNGIDRPLGGESQFQLAPSCIRFRRFSLVGQPPSPPCPVHRAQN